MLSSMGHGITNRKLLKEIYRLTEGSVTKDTPSEFESVNRISDLVAKEVIEVRLIFAQFEQPEICIEGFNKGPLNSSLADELERLINIDNSRG